MHGIVMAMTLISCYADLPVRGTIFSVGVIKAGSFGILKIHTHLSLLSLHVFSIKSDMYLHSFDTVLRNVVFKPRLIYDGTLGIYANCQQDNTA